MSVWRAMRLGFSLYRACRAGSPQLRILWTADGMLLTWRVRR